MTRLSLRLAIGGGREAIVRLVLTALGVALGVGLLLFATVAFPALHGHDVRQAWQETTEHNRRPAQDERNTDPMLWRTIDDQFGSRSILRVDIAAEGPRSPVPPGISRLPGRGEIAMSPAMERLVRTTDPALLGARYPGRLVETIGKDALAGPSDLVVLVGHTPNELRGAADVFEIRSIEAAAVDHGLTQFMRAILAVGAVGLLVPIVVFVSTATRLAAARREQRLAALRLAGATPRQVVGIAAVEAALAAAIGGALGTVVFLAVRPFAVHIPFDGHQFYTSDARVHPLPMALVLLGVPVLAVLAAMVSLRKIQISPLGVSRRAAPKRPSARRLWLIPPALVLFLVSVRVAIHGHAGNGEIAFIVVTFSLLIAAFVFAGPWLTARVAHAIARFSRRPSSLLAARRLEDDPSAGFRAISGITLAVFVASLFAVLAAASRAETTRAGGSLGRTTVGAQWSSEANPGMPLERATSLLSSLRSMPGVTGVVPARTAPAGSYVDALDAHEPRPAVITCDDARRLGLPSCTGTELIDLDRFTFGKGGRGVVLDGTPPPASMLATLPLDAVAVLTDGSTSTIERVRTRLVLSDPHRSVVTGADVVRDGEHTLTMIDRLTNAGLGITLLIAGCSLAVAVAGGLVERTRPFALLRLSGMRTRELHGVVAAESASPLLVTAAASAVAGQAVAVLLLAMTNNDIRTKLYVMPSWGYWAALAGGIVLALAVVSATLPLLDRMTSLDAVRFE